MTETPPADPATRTAPPAGAPHAPDAPVGDAGDRLTPVYGAVMTLTGPIVRRWARLETTGLEHLPRSGPLLVVGNHDSHWDPVVVGVAARERRQIRALAKSSLWKNRALAWVMEGMGQIPIERGKGDAHALDRAIEELRAGSCIGVFPEGTISRGQFLRPRSGAGRLARAVPEATVVSVAVTGVVDVVRFPKRPRIRVAFFPAAGGPIADGEEPGAYMGRVVAEIRERAPIALPGRRRKAAALRAKAEAATRDDGAA